jgi:DNA replication licensing factor MCM2
LTAPILSRFDLLAVVKDDVDEEYDDALATFVINSHMKNHPNIIKRTHLAQSEGKSVEEQTQELQSLQEEFDQMLLPNNRMNNQRTDLIPHQMLKKYLIYSRRFIRPKLSEID